MLGFGVRLRRQLPSIQFCCRFRGLCWLDFLCTLYFVGIIILPPSRGDVSPGRSTGDTWQPKLTTCGAARSVWQPTATLGDFAFTVAETSARGQLGSSHGTDVWLQGKTLFPRLYLLDVTLFQKAGALIIICRVGTFAVTQCGEWCKVQVREMVYHSYRTLGCLPCTAVVYGRIVGT